MIGLLFHCLGSRHLQTEAAPAVRRPNWVQAEGGSLWQDARTRGRLQTWWGTKLQANSCLSIRTRGSIFRLRQGWKQGYFTHKYFSNWVHIWKPCISSFTWGMVAFSALESGCVAAQNVEVTCMRPAQLRKQEKNPKLNVVLNVLNQLYFKKMCGNC